MTPPKLDLAKLRKVCLEAWHVHIARQDILDFINGVVFPPLIPNCSKSQSTVDEYEKKRDQLKSILLSRVMNGSESIAATMLKLAEEKQKAVEEAIDETNDKLNDTWLECVKAALSGEELFDDEMSTEQRQAVELIWKAARKGDAAGE